MPASAKWTLRQ